jgi:tetratricopeptide (TPR) repeat protein
VEYNRLLEEEVGIRAAALNNLALNYRAAGEPARAIELTQKALDLCALQGDRHHQAALHNNLADLLHANGQSDAAMANLKQAVAIFAEIGEAGTWQP